MCQNISNCNRFLNPSFKTRPTHMNLMNFFPTINTVLMWFSTIRVWTCQRCNWNALIDAIPQRLHNLSGAMDNSTLS